MSLLNGADCAAPANPLRNVLKREGVDNSLFHDRMGGSSSGSASQAFRPMAAGPSHAGPAQQGRSSVPHPFNLSHLASALAQPVQAGPVPMGPSPAEMEARFQMHAHQAWDRHPQQSASPAPGPQQFAPQGPAGGAWADSFQQGKGKGRAAPPPQSFEQAQPQMYGGMPPNPFGQMGLQPYEPRLQPMYGQQMNMPQQQQPAQLGAGHAEMEAAFEAALADARAQAAEEVKEPVELPQKAAVAEPVEEEEEQVKDFKGELDAVWESLKPEAERLNQLAEWEKEFSQFVDGEDDTFDILERDLARDDIGQTGLDDQMEFGTGNRWLEHGMAQDGLPAPVEYQWAMPNKFDGLAPAQAWAEANRVLASGGSLSDGSLLIETFLRNATDADLAAAGVSRAEAWCKLGRTQAENEMEDKALAAYEAGRKCLDTDPKAKQVAGELLTNLAISYVNESLDLAALTTLHQVLTNLHPQFAGQAPTREEFIASDNPWALHQRMTEHYLNLARDQYSKSGHVDPDVQVGLGTLYYMTGDYGEARSCWVAALGERPDDYLLWNRLGATLANGGEPEQAVDAYRRALEIKPSFVRAIANLGVACLNIGVHREAAEHFLAALALQPTDPTGGVGSESYSLWATLRRALVALDERELSEQARPGTDLNVFRRAGFEF